MKILIIVVFFMLAGCGSTGTPIQASTIGSFVKGQTTSSDVVAALGKPQSSTLNSDGSSTLVYMHVNTNVHASTFIPIVGAFTGGATSKAHSVIIEIDSQGFVSDWKQTETETVYNN
jgi:hypothetical protein